MTAGVPRTVTMAPGRVMGVPRVNPPPAAGSPADRPLKFDRGVFRFPRGPLVFSLVVTIVISVLSLGAAVFCVLVLVQGHWGVAVFLALLTAFMFELARYVGRDLSGKWGFRVGFGADALELSLPARRSLVRSLKAVRRSVPYAEIAAVETRLEAYPSLGMVSMQRPFALRLKDANRIFLFEERAQGTDLASGYFTDVVNEIAGRAGVHVEELGMTEGRGGVLAAWGAHAADWAAESPLPARQETLWNRAVSTGRIAVSVFILAFVVRMAIRLIG